MRAKKRINDLVRVTESYRAGSGVAANEHVFPREGIQNESLLMFA